MTKVILDISMSFDGFITGPHESDEQPLGDGGERLHDWMGSNPPASFKQGGTSETMGAAVLGRRTYDQIHGYGGTHPAGIKPLFVVSEDTPSDVPVGNSTFTFVSDGIASAVSQAREAAGEKDVYIIGGASIAQQCLDAGLLDEMRIHVAHTLMGGGVRLFGDHNLPGNLEVIEITPEDRVTHFILRPVKLSR